jgi:hypothetical protein
LSEPRPILLVYTDERNGPPPKETEQPMDALPAPDGNARTSATLPGCVNPS